MASKQTMNVFEAHVEKLVIAIAVVIFGWILFAGTIKPKGVDVRNEILKPSEILEINAKKAKDITRKMDEPSDPAIKRYAPQVNTFNKTHILSQTDVDRMPLTPIFRPGGPITTEKRVYALPTIGQLENPKINLTQAVALIPNQQSDSARPPTRLELQNMFQQLDVDFVTIEATYNIEELRQQFITCFTAPTLERPLEENATPIFALVLFQRARLSPQDGQWGQFQPVPRLEAGDQIPLQMPTLESKINDRSNSAYQMLLARTSEPKIQRQLLRPSPYEFQNLTWLPPTMRQEEEQRRPSPAETVTRQKKLKRQPKPSKRNLPLGKKSGFPPIRGAIGTPTGIPVGMPIGPVGDMYNMMPTPQITRTHRTLATSGDLQVGNWFHEEQITFWAHDGMLKSGDVYRYRMRLGFFNPIAGKGWLAEDQLHLDNQRILWSDWVSPDKWVRTPQHVRFFPKAAGTNNSTAAMDIYRLQNGKWYKKTFLVAPGSTIGQEKYVSVSDRKTRSVARSRRKPKSDTSDTDERIQIDFRTFATLLDIIPNSRHWSRQGSRLQEKVTTDLIYRAQNGDIQRLSVDSYCWPPELKAEHTTIKKAIRAQNKGTR